MQDLDFDELDKAVNSLVQYTTPKLTADNEPEDTVLDLGTGDISLPDLATQPAITPIPNFAPSQVPLAGRRVNGRFMDVVPPSASTRVNPAMPERVSRQGLSINPDDSLPMVPESAPMPAVIPEVKSNEWPDPIDFQGVNKDTSNESEAVKSEDNEDADIDQISNDITNTLNQTVDEPQDSPFLSGTKVEKRPLGAFSSEQSAIPVVQQESQTEAQQSTDLSSQTQPQAEVSHMPAELHPDLLSIESGSAVVPNVPSMGNVADTITVDATPTPSVTSESVANTQPEGPTSITQQYSEQPSTGDQTTGAIYDTDSYHKAILAPTKKKSGLMLILGILLLIVIGAGAGAAVYFFALPR